MSRIWRHRQSISQEHARPLSILDFRVLDWASVMDELMLKRPTSCIADVVHYLSSATKDSHNGSRGTVERLTPHLVEQRVDRITGARAPLQCDSSDFIQRGMLTSPGRAIPSAGFRLTASLLMYHCINQLRPTLPSASQLTAGHNAPIVSTFLAWPRFMAAPRADGGLLCEVAIGRLLAGCWRCTERPMALVGYRGSVRFLDPSASRTTGPREVRVSNIYNRQCAWRRDCRSLQWQHSLPPSSMSAPVAPTIGGYHAVSI
ncbi:hypothetical protein BU24DRAFT_262670 [Aaosphaeria arxii CBS 175.79]|uniref:Uncharacterized protein n=1 Tax=Aaosphaeria arxii CBS 175.79 TaxID=1450172 RepID=A0A6A5XL47_9PLEO|nr:uncharacterized protein BU24DRAFT_262670 [Aaosphaeria arxii CBS 175.79]KAF2013024.1 hypothetical protein BU24DRAFT_262670 [Aaosphaeria arxii CBS 175.79]